MVKLDWSSISTRGISSFLLERIRVDKAVRLDLLVSKREWLAAVTFFRVRVFVIELKIFEKRKGTAEIRQFQKILTFPEGRWSNS
jgi:hypothetical protein